MPLFSLCLGPDLGEIPFHVEVCLLNEDDTSERGLVPQKNEEAHLNSIGQSGLMKLGLVQFISRLPKYLTLCLHRLGGAATVTLRCTVDLNFQGDLELTTPMFDDVFRLLVREYRPLYRPMRGSTEPTQSMRLLCLR